jgi:acetolactate synthase-1/2/3 large subunit
MHKESHQVLDLVSIFRPVSKYSAQILEPENIPEVVRKSFKLAQSEKPGSCFIDLPENIAEMTVGAELEPLPVRQPPMPEPPANKVDEAAELISRAQFPIIMAGNGVIRAGASTALIEFAEALCLPVATTFMAKGAIPASHPLFLGTVGLQASDYISCGMARADVIICVGYDMVEYHPHLWNAGKDKRIIHIDASAAEVDAHYPLEVGVVGDIGLSLGRLIGKASRPRANPASTLRQTIVEERQTYAEDTGFPVKPQKILWDLRASLQPDDVVVCDVGAHKMWLARMFAEEKPNTCIISNGFASMGIAVPGAIAAKLVHPDRTAVAVTGDAGFLMNSQEIETALRIGAPIVILVWRDDAYGLIEWKQMNQFGRPSNIKFGNPDLVKYAESFGAKGYRVENATDLAPTLHQAIADDTVVVIDCPVDYRENLKLTKKLGELICPI